MTKIMVKCPKCENEIVELRKWQLDRALKSQVALVANKPKYSKTVFEKKYARTERWIREIDPKFYKEVKIA
jgi:hypothetical protein